MKVNNNKHNGFKGFVFGTIFGIALSVGVLFETGHLQMNTETVQHEVNYTFETTEFNGFSFK